MRKAVYVSLGLAMAVALSAPAVTTGPADAKILHALGRLTFGPRPGDLEQVREMGLVKWIDLQLNPKKIPESPVLLEKLRPLDTLNMTTRDLVKNYPTPQMIAKLAAGDGTYPSEPAKRRLVEVQVDQYRRQRSADAPDRPIATFLTPEQRQTLQSGKREERVQVLNSLSGLELDEALLFTPRRAREQLYPVVPPELRRRIQKSLGAFRIIDQDLVNGKLYRAIYSNQQLAEVLSDFWFNHFNIYQPKGDDRFMVTAYEREVVRPRVMGKFKDLLLATAQSPAMLVYLDNYQSVAEGTTRGRKKKVADNGAEKRGLNENYGRELMELHTMGVDGGYTQKDVTEVARCFTGWTVKNPAEGGGFEFDRATHDDRAKVVLGVRIPKGGGVQDGLKVLDILIHHPSTAHFISWKLAVRFVADNPPKSLVDRMAKTFTNSGGDIREVMQTMLESDEFWSEQTYRAKVKSPLELVASAVRALGSDVDYADALADKIAEAGEPLYKKQEPTGYSNSSEEWVNTASLLARMNFGLALAGNRIPGVKPPDPKILAEFASLQPAADAKPDLARAAGLYLGGPEFQRK
jgi:uncharacterized protein (DUF1800 family)